MISKDAEKSSAETRSRLSKWNPRFLLRGTHSSLIVLVMISLLNYIDRQVLAAVVPALRAALFPGGQVGNSWIITHLVGLLKPFLGANPENALIGLLSMAFMVTYIIFAPIFGRLKVRRWWLIGGALALWSLASGASGLATTFGVLLLTRCFVGLGEAAYGPIAPTIIADSYGMESRGKAISWFYMTIPVGSALGFALGGVMAGSFLGWRWAFFSMVLPGLIMAVICLFMRDPKHGQKALAQPPRASVVKEYVGFLKNRSYLLNILGMTAMTFAIGGIGFWMPSYIHEFRHVSSLAEVNIIFGAILVVSGLLGTIAGGWVGDKLQTRHPGAYFLVSGGAMLLAFPSFLAALYVPFPYAWGLLFVACLCLFFNTGPTNTIIANVIPSHQRAGAFALSILFTHALGDVISPLVIGAVTDATQSMTKAFLVVSIMVLIGGLLWLWGARYLTRDMALAAAADLVPEVNHSASPAGDATPLETADPTGSGSPTEKP